MAENETTTICVSRTTKEKLDKLGTFGESYDDLLNRLSDTFLKVKK